MVAAQSVTECELDAPVWVSCPEAVWRPGRVTSKDDAEGGVVVQLEAGGAVSVSQSGAGGLRMLRRNVALLGDGALRFDDLTDVPELHEAAVLHALHVRFSAGCIYTLTGAVLLAMNPFRPLPNLYSSDVLQSFLRGSSSGAPHIFGIASAAMRGIREQGQSQTVLISGESGAGKTETTKFVMQFLALAGATQGASEAGSVSAGMSRVERQVLGSNPLLEAFGNAKTLRNDNSSRFGKYIELQFGSQTLVGGFFKKVKAFFADDSQKQVAPRLEGARIRTYLLEKVRVLAQKDGERSFHIFYQALAYSQTPERLAAAGLPLMAATVEQVVDNRGVSATARSMDCEVDLSGFSGCSATSFAYLHRGTAAVPGLNRANEAEDFEATLLAMRTVGLGVGETSEIFRVLAAVLHLGNVEFAAHDSGEASKVAATADASTSPLQVVCRLLGLGEAELEGALCSRLMKAPGEGVIRMTNDVGKASEIRDALARHAYHAIFCHVVARTNESIGFVENALFCGVLDIFGFEFFDINTFEQLCINYTNELLQQFFNTFIFDNEIALYKAEGIAWEDLVFPDNGAIVELLQQKPSGIFPMLDEECFTIGGSSSAWRQKLVKKHETHPHLSIVKQHHGTFVIQHFAGPVTYTADGFLEKNRDQLSPDVLQCLQNSRSAFVRDCFLEQNRTFGASSAMGDQAKVVKAQRSSVSSDFRQQLQALMQQIRSTVPNFVRCIKPNPLNKPFAEIDGSAEAALQPLFNRRSVAEQLSHQGVLEAIRVARSGFAVRFSHRDFLSDFGCLAGHGLRKLSRRSDSLGEKSEVDACDASHVRKLLASPELQHLLAALGGSASTVPTGWAIGKTRIFLKSEQFAVLKAAQVKMRHASATRIQAAWRCRAAWAAFTKFCAGMRRLQARARGASARGEMWRRRRERAAISIQGSLRTLLVRDHRRRMCVATVVLQSFARKSFTRSVFLQRRAQIVKLQRWWRSLVKRRRWRNLQQNVLRIQRVWRGAAGRLRALDHLARRKCLERVVRKLVRIRSRSRARQAWKRECLAGYRNQVRSANKLNHDALASGLIDLWKDSEAKQLEIARLRDAKVSLEKRKALLEQRRWIRFISGICSVLRLGPWSAQYSQRARLDSE